jgi:hypothetical protein
MGYTVLSKYETNLTEVRPIKLSPAHLAVAGTPPSGAVDNPEGVKVTRNKRAIGLRPRGVRLARQVGTVPNQGNRYAFLPVLTNSAWSQPEFAVGATITIGGNQWTVIESVQETPGRA